MAGYQLHEDARDDLDDLWEHLAEAASPEVATRIEDEFFAAFAMLTGQPHMGFHQPELTSRSVRFWVLHSYLIAYAPEQRPLLILAIVHGRRHPRVIASILTQRR